MRKFLCSPIIAVLSVIASCQATDNVSKSKLSDVVGELSGKFPYLEELGDVEGKGCWRTIFEQCLHTFLRLHYRDIKSSGGDPNTAEAPSANEFVEYILHVLNNIRTDPLLQDFVSGLIYTVSKEKFKWEIGLYIPQVWESIKQSTFTNLDDLFGK